MIEAELDAPAAGPEDVPRTPTGLDTRQRGVGTVRVRPLRIADASEFTRLANGSRGFHQKWIKLPTERNAFDHYLSRFDGENSFCFVVCDGEQIVGSVSLTDIQRSDYYPRPLTAFIGYGVFEPYAEKGFTSLGVNCVLDYAFGELDLLRVEADIQPGNDPSKRLIEKMGFSCQEVRRYRHVNGQLAGHERWALTNSDRSSWNVDHPADMAAVDFYLT